MPVLDQITISNISSGTKIDAIVESIKKEQCILFLGSGAHFQSAQYNYPESECPPLGSKFSEELAPECDFSTHFPEESARNLPRVSMCYEIAHSRPQLVSRIREAVHDNKKPSPALIALAKLPFPLIITTNYDRLFEAALTEAGKEPRVDIYNKDEHSTTPVNLAATPKEPYLFKLHGDIQKPDSIVITDEDYIQFVLRMSDKDPYHPVPEVFRYHFKIWPTLFVGYSLLDYNLRLLFKTLRWKVDKALFQPTYSVDPYPDPLIFDVWYNQTKYVTFVAQDVWTFVPKLYQQVTGQAM